MFLFKKVIKKLLTKNITISVAESCTGGLIANTITKYSGVSKIFSYGIIAYSNKAKSKYLSVSKTNLSKFGAVKISDFELGVLDSNSKFFALNGVLIINKMIKHINLFICRYFLQD